MKALRDFSRIVLLFGVCAIPACGPPTVPRVTPARLVAPDPRDGEVLQAVLLDLLGGMSAAITNRAKILLHARTSDWAYLLNAQQIRRDIRDQALPSDLEGALLRSNRPNTVTYFTNLTFASPIVVADLTGKMGDEGWEALVNAYPGARLYVVTALPGYSEDGTRAVVRARFGPSAHGATVTALLEKSGDKWVVKWHRLAYYA